MVILPLANIIQTGMKAAFYGRHSTDKQTMDTQRAMAFELAKKYSCEIVKEYGDPGVSARKKELEKREGISLLLKDAIDGKFDFIVINNHDRIARNPMEHQKIRMILSGCNIPVVVCISESLYDSGDFIVDLIKDGTSKLEVDNTRTRTRDTAKTIASQGKWTGGKAPYGYRYHKTTKTFSSCKEELDIVKRIYELYRDREGFQSVANLISEETGKPFSKTMVKWIITNPFYAGYISPHRKSAGNSLNPFENWTLVKSDLIEPIMTLEEWKETWALYEQRKAGALNPKMYKTSFLFSNLLFCSVCDDALRCSDKTTFDKERNKHYGKKWYLCPNCDYKIEAARLHNVIDALLNNLKSQNLDLVTSLVCSEMVKERELALHKISKSKLELAEAQRELSLVEAQSKQYASNIHDLETEDDNTKMLQIFKLQKQHLTSRIAQLEQDLKLLDKTASYLETVEGNESAIAQKLKSNSVMTGKENERELRKMVSYLVKRADFTPITTGSKNEITKGSIAIQTASSLLEEIIC